MKVALLGATGYVGSALLKEALDRGNTGCPSHRA
jgi:putative NADH-flavin reductase